MFSTLVSLFPANLLTWLEVVVALIVIWIIVSIPAYIAGKNGRAWSPCDSRTSRNRVYHNVVDTWSPTRNRASFRSRHFGITLEQTIRRAQKSDGLLKTRFFSDHT